MFLLSLIRRISRQARLVFGPKPPQAVQDVLALIRHANFFRLSLTIWMVVFYPRHFFKILPQIVRGARKHYVTPVQFLTNIIALQASLFALLELELDLVDKLVIWGANIVLALSAPLAVIALCCGTLALWFVAMHIWPINHVAAEMRFNYHGALLVTNPATYLNLRWKRFAWSILYYYCYFYVLFLPLALLFYLLNEWIIYLPAALGFHRIYLKILAIPYAVVWLSFAALFHALFIRPYVALLLYSSRSLSTRAWRYLAYDYEHRQAAA